MDWVVNQWYPVRTMITKMVSFHIYASLQEATYLAMSQNPGTLGTLNRWFMPVYSPKYGSNRFWPIPLSHWITIHIELYQSLQGIYQVIFETNVSGWWYTYPSEKWWSSSVGMMKFPTEWKIIIHHNPVMFQTNHQPVYISINIH